LHPVVQDGSLEISDVADDSPTVFDFVSPSCGSYFNVGSEIPVGVNVSDEDDLITGSVSVMGNVTPFGNSGVSFNHIFDYAGNFQVIAEAVDSDGNMLRKVSSVMSIDNTTSEGDYAAACIDEPSDFVNINTSEVWFDASSSQGIRRVDGVNNVISPPDAGLNFYWSFSDGRINQHITGDDELSYLFNKRFSIAGNNWAVLRVELV